jgi:hypothetical protein
MTASSGAVTLTPYRMTSDFERLQSAEQRAFLSLTDLGHLGGAGDGGSSLISSPVPSRSEVVLLLPWSLLSIVAELDVVARTTSRKIPSCYAPEDWLTAWHHFVDVDDWGPLALEEDAGVRADILSKLPFMGTRHFILATDPDVRIPHVDSHRVALHNTEDSPYVHDHVAAAMERELRDVDPLVFTNPGSTPEGLSPLFRVPLSRQPT